MLKQRLSVFVMSVIVVWAAFWLRFDRLATIPFSWHLDEAAHGLEARDVLAGHWPVFFSQFTGHEALFSYLLAGAFALFGDSIWSARLVSAAAGVLTVALTIPLGAVLWPARRGRQIGQWAALLLAVSLWHLIQSRNSYRAILQPLVQLPALIFLFKAVRHSAEKRWRVWGWWALAGFFTGLNVHTYLAARAFPVVIGGAALTAIALGPDRARRLAGLALAGVTAALVVAPLVWHFYRTPIDAAQRTEQVMVGAGDEARQVFWQNTLDALQMFTVKGDYSHKRNIRDAPVFDPLTGALFFIGLAYAALGLARRTRALISVTLLSGLVVMLLPGILSVAGIPNYLRLIGALPVVMIFPALALEWAWSTAARFISARVPWRHTAAGYALLAPFIGLTIAAYPRYFEDWHNVIDNDIERVVQAAYFARDVQPGWSGGPVYLSTAYPEHVTLAYLNPQMYAMTHGFDSSQSVPLPPEGRPADYYILLENQPNAALLQKAGLRPIRTAVGRFGQPVYDVYRWEGRWPMPSRTAPMGWGWEMQFPPGWRPTSIPAPVNFQDNLSLLGYDLSADTVAAGEALTLTLYWQLNGPLDGPYSMFAHVLDRQGRIAAQYDDNRYPAAKWRAGEMLLGEFPITIPPGTPPDQYQLAVGVYHLFTGQRMVILSAGAEIADRLFLQPITVR